MISFLQDMEREDELLAIPTWKAHRLAGDRKGTWSLFVTKKVIEPLELSVTGAAQVLGVTRAALSALLNERSNLSPEVALRIEKAFGVSMDTLMRMQNSYDIAQARMREGDIQVAPFPVNRSSRSRRFLKGGAAAGSNRYGGQ